MDVNLSLPASACSLVDQDGQRIVEPGAFDLLVGRHSHDELMLTATFRITTLLQPLARLGSHQVRSVTVPH